MKVFIGAAIGGALAFMIWIGVAHLSGCANKATQADPKPYIENVADVNKSVAARLPERADKIDANTDTIQKTVSPTVQIKIGPAVTGIRTETAGLRDDAARLQDTLKTLDDAKAAVGQLRASEAKLKAAVTKLEDEKKQGTRKLVGALVTMSILGLGISAAVFASGNKAGMFGGIGCLVTLVAAVVVGWYSFWLALAAGVVLIAGVGFVVHRMLAERRATEELVQTGEAAKQLMTHAARQAIYGDGAIPGKADLMQSESTQALVKTARGKKTTAKVRLAV